MLIYRSQPDSPIVEIDVEGQVTGEDVSSVYDKLTVDIAHHGTIKVLERIGPLNGIEPAAIWADLKLAPSLLGKISHAAVVADQKWIKAGVGLVRHFIPTEMRQFDLDELIEARAWLMTA